MLLFRVWILTLCFNSRKLFVQLCVCVHAQATCLCMQVSTANAKRILLFVRSDIFKLCVHTTCVPLCVSVCVFALHQNTQATCPLMQAGRWFYRYRHSVQGRFKDDTSTDGFIRHFQTLESLANCSFSCCLQGGKKWQKRRRRRPAVLPF